MTDHFSTQIENKTPVSYHNDVLEKQFSYTVLPPFHASLSVILPTYNEEQVISSTLNDVLMTLNGQVRDFEVIVVNDGSKDRTATIVEVTLLKAGEQ